MQFTTKLLARLPRNRCPEHGVKTIVPPWAGRHSKFTFLFEAFAIEVPQAEDDDRLEGTRQFWLFISSVNQVLTYAARRFRSFGIDRIRILFSCRRLK